MSERSLTCILVLAMTLLTFLKVDAQQPTMEAVEIPGLPVNVIMHSADPLLKGEVWEYRSFDSGKTWTRQVWKPWEGPVNQRSKSRKLEERNLPVSNSDNEFLRLLGRRFIGPGARVRVGSIWNLTGNKKYDDNEEFAGFVYPRDRHRLRRGNK